MLNPTDLVRHAATSIGRKIVCGCAFVLASAALCILPPAGLAGQKPVPSSQSTSFGPITQFVGTGPAIVEIPFHLSVAKSVATHGYRVSGNSSFTFTPSAPTNQGKTISAADISVGMVSVSAGGASTIGSLPNQPGNSGMILIGTIANLLHGQDLLRVGKASGAAIPATDTDCYILLRLVIPTGYFTPGFFSGTLTLSLIP